MADLHTHVLPAVNDGARDVDEGVAALEALSAAGVTSLVATPHFAASLLDSDAVATEVLDRCDRALAELGAALAESAATFRLERGVELKLDAPTPRLDDDRLRLAGTRFVLVEFAGFRVPPYAASQLRSIVDIGWVPVLAHPERYTGLAGAWPEIESWRDIGVRFQLTHGSLVGSYGDRPAAAARALLAAGWIDYLSTDYHSRGEQGVEPALEGLRKCEGGAAVVRLLTDSNPHRLLDDEKPVSMPPVAVPELGRWRGRRQFRL